MGLYVCPFVLALIIKLPQSFYLGMTNPEVELQRLEALAIPTASRWRQTIFGDGN